MRLRLVSGRLEYAGSMRRHYVVAHCLLRSLGWHDCRGLELRCCQTGYNPVDSGLQRLQLHLELQWLVDAFGLRHRDPDPHCVVPTLRWCDSIGRELWWREASFVG